MPARSFVASRHGSSGSASGPSTCARRKSRDHRIDNPVPRKYPARRSDSEESMSSSRCLVSGIVLFVAALVSSSITLHGQTRTAREGVYGDAQARRGQDMFKERCAVCHGDALQGQLAPPLTGDEFLGVWGGQPLSALVSKIQNTMPANDPG